MRRPWTEDEIKLARKMRAAGHSYEEIDWALRGSGDTAKRQHECQTTSRQDALIAARNQRALTLPHSSGPHSL
jgi:hypothetical protein